MDADVLIAGAGPVGLALAVELVRHGAVCRIVDAQPGADGAFSRATEVHARTLELLDLPGLADEVVAGGIAVARIPFYSRGREIAAIDLRVATDSPFPFSLVLPQSETERILERALGRAGVAIERGRRLVGLDQDGDGVTATLAGADAPVRACYLVACDGVHSGVREALGIAFEGGEYAGRWAALDAEVQGWPWTDDVVPVYLDHEGFWAMTVPSGRRRLFFLHEAAGDTPTRAEAQAVLDRHLLDRARVVAVDDALCFQLHHRVAARYRGGRVFLAGDAAHVSTPVAGRNMNVGIQDAFNLAWKLALACSGAAAQGVLDSYEAERRPVAQAMVAAVDAIQEGNLIEVPPAAVDERDHALGALMAGPQRAEMAEESYELRLGYPDSPIVAPGAGARVAPEPPALRELLRSPRHLLLVAPGAEPPELRRFAAHVDTHALEADPALRLVRPDAYLTFAGGPDEAAALRDVLGRTFG